VRSTRCSGELLLLLLEDGAPSSGAAAAAAAAAADPPGALPDWLRTVRCELARFTPDAPGDTGKPETPLSFDAAGVAEGPCRPARYDGVCGGRIEALLVTLLRPRSGVPRRKDEATPAEDVPGRKPAEGVSVLDGDRLRPPAAISAAADMARWAASALVVVDE
jgi:hypothetical protein